MAFATLRWVESKLFIATGSNNHSVVIGFSPDDPAQYVGVKAPELLLMSAAACSAFDVVEILRKQRQPLRELSIECRGEQLSEPPYSFTCIHLHYLLEGDLDVAKVERAIHLSEDKYCSVISTLRKALPVTSDFEIRS